MRMDPNRSGWTPVQASLPHVILSFTRVFHFQGMTNSKREKSKCSASPLSFWSSLALLYISKQVSHLAKAMHFLCVCTPIPRVRREVSDCQFDTGKRGKAELGLEKGNWSKSREGFIRQPRVAGTASYPRGITSSPLPWDSTPRKAQFGVERVQINGAFTS